MQMIMIRNRNLDQTPFDFCLVLLRIGQAMSFSSRAVEGVGKGGWYGVFPSSSSQNTTGVDFSIAKWPKYTNKLG